MRTMRVCDGVKTERVQPRGLESLPLWAAVTIIYLLAEHIATRTHMAGSRFEYVKAFELPDPLLPATYIVLRIDGHAFHR